MRAAYAQLEQAADSLTCDPLMQSDITSAVTWRFTQLYTADIITPADYPRLAVFSASAEALPDFIAAPVE